MLLKFVCILILCPLPLRAQDRDIERRIDSLLHIMKLEEKCGQLVQIPATWSPERKSHLTEEDAALVRKGLVGSVMNASGNAQVRDIQRIAVEESRLRIPLIIGVDIIHGYRTIFPVPLAEASSWDPALAEQSARVAAIEASSAGIHWTFAPMVDIARDPRWGRIVEGSGEDPYLGSLMAAARVRGFQGNRLSDSSSILACLKHFAAYGGAEGGRDYNSVDVSERTMREVYLRPFHAAVEAGAGSLMSSFNEISGVPSSASKWLMSDVLRKEWGFQGFVVSDWTAIEELIMHGVAADRGEAGKLAIEAGVDLDMVSRIYMKELPALVRSGKVKESVVDESVRRVLRMKFKLGLFDDPYRGINAEREKRSILAEDHLQKALASARKSIVLLKNENNLLPLSKQIKTVALIGPLADDAEDMLGGWHASGKAENVVTILQGIKNALGPSANLLYAKGCGIDDSTENFTDALEKARQAEVVVVALGESERMSGEASSRATLDLPGVQMELLQKIVATGVPTVLILTNGRPLTIGWPAAHVPAIVETWFLGVQAGPAIADVLFGDENPSGRLPVTFPRSVGQVPLYYNHKNTGRPYSEKEHYTSKYIDMPNTPLFPFGYGLSYTSFAYSDLKVSSPVVGSSDSIKVTVRVANTGPRKGEEVVQLYLRDDVASVTRPVKELKRFARIALDSGAAQSVSFVLYPDDLSMYNLEMKKVIEPGTFTVFVGKNSEDVMEAKFEVK